MARPRILLVDDDQDFLEIAKAFLQLNNYDVVAISDLAVARRMLEEEPFTAAFLDINFDNRKRHDKRGLELAIQTIRTSSVPKVILTVHNTHENTRAALVSRDGKSGAAIDFLYKADGLPQMLEAIERIVQRARIFLSYAKPDFEKVKDLYERLQMSGFVPWMDKMDIDGGANWEVEVRHAMRKTDFVVLCLSEASLNRTSFFQTEIEFAMTILSQQPPGKIFLVPTRLEECEISHPNIPQLQWIDYFESDGYDRLTRALQEGIRRRASNRTS